MMPQKCKKSRSRLRNNENQNQNSCEFNIRFKSIYEICNKVLSIQETYMWNVKSGRT